jgi:hypothetical protein
MQIAAILGHELAHAAPSGWRLAIEEFRPVAHGIGLIATNEDDHSREKALQTILEEAGSLPHGRLQSTILPQQSLQAEKPALQQGQVYL